MRKRTRTSLSFSNARVVVNCHQVKDFSYWCVFPFSQFLLLRRKWLDRTVNHGKFGAMSMQSRGNLAALTQVSPSAWNERGQLSAQEKQFMDEILTEDMRWNEMKLKLDSHFNHRPCEGPCGYEAAALNRMAV